MMSTAEPDAMCATPTHAEPQDGTPAQAAPQDAAPAEDAAPRDAAPAQAAPQDAAPMEDAAPAQAAPQDAPAQNATAQNAAPQDAAQNATAQDAPARTAAPTPTPRAAGPAIMDARTARAKGLMMERWPATTGLGHTLLCWSGREEKSLMKSFKMWARRVGGEKGGNAKKRGLPAVLFPEQVMAYDARAAAGDDAGPVSRRGAVLEDLNARGYVVGSGCRYGGDYVIYARHPDEAHSSHTVRVVGEGEVLETSDIAALCRVQGNVLKKALYAAVEPATRRVSYLELSFDPRLSSDPLKKLERRLAKRMQDETNDA